MCRRLLGTVISHMGYLHKSANSSASLIMLVEKITTSFALLMWKPPQDTGDYHHQIYHDNHK